MAFADKWSCADSAIHKFALPFCRQVVRSEELFPKRAAARKSDFSFGIARFK